MKAKLRKKVRKVWRTVFPDCLVVLRDEPIWATDEKGRTRYFPVEMSALSELQIENMARVLAFQSKEQEQKVVGDLKHGMPLFFNERGLRFIEVMETGDC